MVSDEKKFKAGQRVISPDGEGEVVEQLNGDVKVKLNNGEIKTYQAEKISDDSDAG